MSLDVKPQALSLASNVFYNSVPYILSFEFWYFIRILDEGDIWWSDIWCRLKKLDLCLHWTVLYYLYGADTNIWRALKIMWYVLSKLADFQESRCIVYDTGHCEPHASNLAKTATSEETTEQPRLLWATLRRLSGSTSKMSSSSEEELKGSTRINTGVQTQNRGKTKQPNWKTIIPK